MRINTGLIDPEIMVVEVYMTKGKTFDTLKKAIDYREGLVEEFIRKLPGFQNIPLRDRIPFIQYILDNRSALIERLDYPDESVAPIEPKPVTLMRTSTYHDPVNVIVRSASYKTHGKKFDTLKQAIAYRKDLVDSFFAPLPGLQNISYSGRVAFIKSIHDGRSALIDLLNYPSTLDDKESGPW